MKVYVINFSGSDPHPQMTEVAEEDLAPDLVPPASRVRSEDIPTPSRDEPSSSSGSPPAVPESDGASDIVPEGPVVPTVFPEDIGFFDPIPPEVPDVEAGRPTGPSVVYGPVSPSGDGAPGQENVSPPPLPAQFEEETESDTSFRPRRKKGKFKVYRQLDQMDCGPTCLRMVARHYGRHYSLQYLRDQSYLTREGVSLLGISEAAESIGMRSMGVKLPADRLKDVPLPCIAHWRQNHFVVIHKITRNRVYVADPAHGALDYTWEEFTKAWARARGESGEEGFLLLLEPTPSFYAQDPVEHGEKRGFRFLFRYLKEYRSFLTQLFVGLIVASLLSLVVPFLAQAIVDQGIQNQNVGLVTALIIAQAMLFLGQTSVGFLQSWITLHVGVRLNLSLLTDFLTRLTQLPIPFFDTRSLGDIIQRVADHDRIQQLLMNNSLGVAFSLFNILVFGIVLALYNPVILLIFLLSSILSVVWIWIFLKRRRELDYREFSENAETQNKLVQIVEGMPEIKLTNSEQQKRWEWERIQAKLFRIATKGLALEQYQSVGLLSINQAANILVTFITAKAVIDGDMTLGMLVAIQYIIGQISAPLAQLVGFVHTVQDARIAVERIGEIYDVPEEESPDRPSVSRVPAGVPLVLENVSFRYGGPQTPAVLDDISLVIPHGRVTAIVGASGSGKTTLVKLLLKLYAPVTGRIQVGPVNLESIHTRTWRSLCGTVMQDGYIFADSIARNIAVGEDNPDTERMIYAAHAANLLPVIESLPAAFGTKIGMDGQGLSGGQTQRLLIARAIYRNPEFIFLDEATSSLDAESERQVMRHLGSFFQGRTVVVVAHRLSTVKNADQIVVLEHGKIVELGRHEELVRSRGRYYQLIRDQLELGN